MGIKMKTYPDNAVPEPVVSKRDEPVPENTEIQKSENTTLKSENATLKSENTKLADKVENLELELGKYKLQNIDAEKLRTRVTTLQADLADMRTDLLESQAAHAGANQVNKNLTDDNNKLMEEIKEMHIERVGNARKQYMDKELYDSWKAMIQKVQSYNGCVLLDLETAQKIFVFSNSLLDTAMDRTIDRDCTLKRMTVLSELLQDTTQGMLADKLDIHPPK